jgi:magnesium chelatase family protein
MLSTVFSGAVYGVDAYRVEIEVNAGRGDPQIIVVGLPDAAVRESRDRVHTAILNAGFKPHIGKQVINLAPADIKKEGPVFDLPIAIGMLAASGEIETDKLDRYAMIGELALSGEVRSVKGVLPIAIRCRDAGLTGLLVPTENAEEAAVVKGLDVHPVASLREATNFLEAATGGTPFHVDTETLFNSNGHHAIDYAEVKGQEQAKRAIEVAVAGGHNCLMIGSPGTGKSMLAKRLPSILPSMTLEEALQATNIHSIAGTLGAHRALIAQRPFRSPHHTISDAGLLGGGTHPAPGEVSLAHHGVLFLDELPEFRRNVLEVLRQPLEDGHVTISRASGSVTFPCRFMLVAAMNPCPCGFYGDPKRDCRCTDAHIHKYRNKISGPLLDRIDIHVEVPPISHDDLMSLDEGEPSAAIRERAIAARHIQQERFARAEQTHCNANMSQKETRAHCLMNNETQQLLRSAINELNFSARAYDRILKVARTIADLAQSESIEIDHVGEAIQYRTLDRQLWS